MKLSAYVRSASNDPSNRWRIFIIYDDLGESFYLGKDGNRINWSGTYEPYASKREAIASLKKYYKVINRGFSRSMLGVTQEYEITGSIIQLDRMSAS